MIRSLSAAGFRSIRDARIELERTTVLVGANGAGKTNLFYALRTLGEVAARGLYGDSDERRFGELAFDAQTFRLSSDGRWKFRVEVADGDGEGSYETEVGRLGPGEGLRIFRERLDWKHGNDTQVETPSGGGDLSVAGETFRWPTTISVLSWLRQPARAAAPEAKAARSLLRALGDLRRYAPEPTRLRRAPLHWEGPPQASGHGFAAHLRSTRDRPGGPFAAIVERLRKVAPFVEDVGFDLDAQKKQVRLLFKNRGIAEPMDARLFSDGTVLALFYAWLSVTADAGAVVFVEDLERSIHPYAYRYLFEFLAEAARDRDFQVVFATHSPDFVNESCKGHVERLRIVEHADERGTTVRCPAAEPDLQELLERYRDAPGGLWYSGAIGGYDRVVAGD